jgi:hypothetical protein
VFAFLYFYFVLQCFWALGACFEVALALVVMPTLGWQWLLALSTGPLLAFALVCPVSNKRNIICIITLLIKYSLTKTAWHVRCAEGEMRGPL